MVVVLYGFPAVAEDSEKLFSCTVEALKHIIGDLVDATKDFIFLFQRGAFQDEFFHFLPQRIILIHQYFVEHVSRCCL